MKLELTKTDIEVKILNKLPDTLDDLFKTLSVKAYESLHTRVKMTKYKLNQVKRNPEVASYKEVRQISAFIKVHGLLLMRKYNMGLTNITVNQANELYDDFINKNSNIHEPTPPSSKESKDTLLHSRTD